MSASHILNQNMSNKSLITQTNMKNYSDKNGNEVSKAAKGRRTFAFWTLVCLLFVLAIGNLMLTFTILGVLKLGQGLYLYLSIGPC